MLSIQSRSFVAITNHLTNDVNKEELFIVKAEEMLKKTQIKLAHIESEKRRGEFVEEKKILQNVKILEIAHDLGVTLEESLMSWVGSFV